MSYKSRVLIQSKALETTLTTQATVDAATIIEALTVNNGGAAASTVSLYLVPAGGTAGTGNLIVARSISAGRAYSFPEVVGQVLEAGDYIAAQAGAGGMVIRASGLEIT